eukprot:4332810-Prymnesium_polylepis.2
MATEEQTLAGEWIKRCSRAALGIFSSEESYHAFVKKCAAATVREGFAGSALDGKEDVQMIIADLSAGSLAAVAATIPHAKVLEMLAAETHDRIAAQLVREIAVAVKERAAQGFGTWHKKVKDLKTAAPYLQLDTPGRRAILKLVQTTLSQAGFRGNGYCAETLEGSQMVAVSQQGRSLGDSHQQGARQEERLEIALSWSRRLS